MARTKKIHRLQENLIPKERKHWDEETIIEKGREMFSEKGFDMSMRDLAKRLGTKASSLYRHVQSKRELWFAITTKDFNDFTNGMNKIISDNSSDKRLRLLNKIGFFFLEFARQDFNRFKLMFLYEPPREENAGPYEKACNPDAFSNLIQICQMIIDQEQLTKIDSRGLALYIYSQILGYTIFTSPINDYLFQKDEFMTMKDASLDKFVVETMITGISLFK